jgi:hypothetical protein
MPRRLRTYLCAPLLAVATACTPASNDTDATGTTDASSSTGATSGTTTPDPATSEPTTTAATTDPGTTSDNPTTLPPGTTTDPDLSTGDPETTTTTTGDPIGSLGCGMTPATGDLEIEVQGQMGQYIVSLPPGYDPQVPYPLGFAFHGRNRTGPNCHDGDCAGFQSVMENDAVLVYMTSLGGTGWEGDGERELNVEFFQKVLDDLVAGACIDESRVFVAGTSSGAHFVNILGCRFGDRLLAIAPVAGYLPEKDNCVDKVAALVIHGFKDPPRPAQRRRGGARLLARPQRLQRPDHPRHRRRPRRRRGHPRDPQQRRLPGLRARPPRRLVRAQRGRLRRQHPRLAPLRRPGDLGIRPEPPVTQSPHLLDADRAASPRARTTFSPCTAAAPPDELLGAHIGFDIDTVEIPPHSDMRKLGIDAVRRYRWTL